jgi:bifunctional pyridoxal-dependent enzyme with beta-cystathionase and maltose regulon repressor activities
MFGHLAPFSLVPFMSCKAVLSFSQCTQRAYYIHESSSAERRNFSDSECSAAVLSAPQNPWGRAFSE